MLSIGIFLVTEFTQSNPAVLGLCVRIAGGWGGGVSLQRYFKSLTIVLQSGNSTQIPEQTTLYHLNL